MPQFNPLYPEIPEDCIVDPVELMHQAKADPEWGEMCRVTSLNGIALLQKYEGLCGVGVGYPEKRGVTDEKEKCFLFFVRKKLSKRRLTDAQIIPKIYSGKRTDIIEVGGDFCSSGGNPRAYSSIIQGSLSIGQLDNPDTFGTLGVVARNIGSSTEVYLTNQHVASDDVLQSANGNIIVHPANAHAVGFSQARLGSVTHSIPILPPPLPNFVDFAKGRCHPRFRQQVSILDPAPTTDVGEVQCLGRVGSVTVTVPVPGMPVEKRGATTLLTQGNILAIGVASITGYGSSVGFFLDQIISLIGHEGGDSGSALLQKGGRNFIGLHYGGFGQFAQACPWWWIAALGGVRI